MKIFIFTAMLYAVFLPNNLLQASSLEEDFQGFSKAIQNSDFNKVKAYISSGIDVNGRKGAVPQESSLGLALKAKAPALLQILVEAGLNVQGNGLYYAGDCTPEVLIPFLETGCDINIEVKLSKYESHSVFNFALDKRNFAVVKALLGHTHPELGVWADIMDSKNLFQAIQKIFPIQSPFTKSQKPLNQDEVLDFFKLFLSMSGGIEGAEHNLRGTFLRSTNYGFCAVMEELISWGLDPNLQDYSDYDTFSHKEIKYSPPYFFINDKPIETVQCLIGLGVDINVTDEYGRNAIHHFAYQQHVHFIEEKLDALISAGCDINNIDYDGNTPLHSITTIDTDQSHTKKICQLLIKHGARQDIKNKHNLLWHEYNENRYGTRRTYGDVVDFDRRDTGKLSLALLHKRK